MKAWQNLWTLMSYHKNASRLQMINNILEILNVPHVFSCKGNHYFQNRDLILENWSSAIICEYLDCLQHLSISWDPLVECIGKVMNLSLCKWQLKDTAEIISINKDYICLQTCFKYDLFFYASFLLMNERNIHFNKKCSFKLFWFRAIRWFKFIF